MVVAMVPNITSGAGAFDLVRMPAGSTAYELGREFRHAPTADDWCHAWEKM